MNMKLGEKESTISEPVNSVSRSTAATNTVVKPSSAESLEKYPTKVRHTVFVAEVETDDDTCDVDDDEKNLGNFDDKIRALLRQGEFKPALHKTKLRRDKLLEMEPRHREYWKYLKKTGFLEHVIRILWVFTDEENRVDKHVEEAIITALGYKLIARQQIQALKKLADNLKAQINDAYLRNELLKMQLDEYEQSVTEYEVLDPNADLICAEIADRKKKEKEQVKSSTGTKSNRSEMERPSRLREYFHAVTAWGHS